VLACSVGLILSIGEESKLGWCPRYNITEQKLDDPISHYPVGKEVKARIIGSLIGEDRVRKRTKNRNKNEQKKYIFFRNFQDFDI